jgi:o-succinylbenzoate---CoA ligase
MATDLLRSVLESGSDPDATAIVSLETVWTLGGLDVDVEQRANEVAGSVAEQGVVHPLVVHQTPESVIDVLALWRLGVTVAPLNPKLTERELATARAELSTVRSNSQAILWTSGTAGRPRGVELSYDGFVASAQASSRRLALSANDLWLASLSFAHVGGLALLIRALLLESDLMAVGPFDVAQLSDVIDGVGFPVGYNRSLTHVSLVPTQLARLIEHRRGLAPPSSLKCVLVGGAHAPERVVGRAIEEGWPVATTYGMTEMTSQVATAAPDLVRMKPGTAGAPLSGTEIQVGPDEEILIRGPTLANRYVGTDAVALTDAEGWYHTGDLGRVDADGHVWITGRRNERIVSGGFTVDAIEVEEVLRAHAAVAEVCVVGIPDAEWGEIIGAFVVGIEGELDLDDLDRHARAALSAAKCPRRWLLDSEVPLGANGKVDRQLIKSLLRDA